MTKGVFDFSDYKAYLSFKVGPRSQRRGIKGALAKHLGIQPTFVSQVLYGKAHFSLEHAEQLADFFGLNTEEKNYFMLLVQKDRAGSRALQHYYAQQISALLQSRLNLTKRLGAIHTLSTEIQAVYYSSWVYAAIHMAVTIPKLQSPMTISKFLNLPLKKVFEVLTYLADHGLIERSGESFLPGKKQIRLGNQSQNIIKHHTHWRHQAIESLDREQISDLHYSGVVTLSEKDMIRLKERILDFINECVTEIRTSKEEELCVFNIDFFSLRKSL
jgi:uncharacterized protein (TIGR02147 family)